MMAILIERKRRRRRRKETILEALQHHYQQIEKQDDISMRCAMMSRKSLSFLLFVSFAFTFISINLIQIANANPQQQQSQQQQTASPTSSFGGQSVIMAQQQVATTSAKARYKTSYACEDRQLTIDCDFGQKINLIRANFGRFSLQPCNEQGQVDGLSIDCMSPITFRIMRERCADKQKCSVNATSAIFGDKCPKTRKYLEVHFQCLPDARISSPSLSLEPEERVDLRNNSPLNAAAASHLLYPPINSGSSSILPPNNPAPASKHSSRASAGESESVPRVQPQPQPQPHQHHQAMTVMNSEILSFSAVTSANNISLDPASKLSEPIEVPLRHTHLENMSNPRCVLWDQSVNQWTERGARVIASNLTHTVCAFEQASSYLLVMDYSGPHSTNSATPSSGAQSSTDSSNTMQISQQQQQTNNPVPLANQLNVGQLINQVPPQPIGPPFPGILDQQPVVLDSLAQFTPKNQQNSQQQQANSSSSSSIVRFFSLFGYLLAFVFVAVAFMTIAFIASTMRSSAGAALKSLGNFSAFSSPKYKGRRADGSLHNKDLLVINNQNGHQCLYSPAQATKINSSTNSHILANQHQNTLHQLQQQQQQQQMYSANGTLSNAGGQSNNYYYGLMGFTHLFQQQQQQQSQIQHHLNHQQQQAANYQHQANKSTVSSESANSSPSSSGIESGSTSVQQQQQQQQACHMLNNDYNLMGHISNYGQLQPTLTLNAHYAPAAGIVPNQQRVVGLNGSMREHIYESVDDDKPYSARLLLPNHQLFHEHQQFSSNTINLSNQHVNSPTRAMTLSTRLLQDAMQQQPGSQMQTQLAANNKRLFSQPAIVRDNQAKTNIVCSKLVQVTPQRATEVNKFQHEVMAIYNANDQTTTTTNSSNSSSYGRTDNLSGQMNKLSTDC